MSFFSARDSVLNLFKKDDSMSGSIFNILMVVMLVNCIGVLVLAWVDTPKLVLNKSEFTEYYKFPNIYLEITKVKYKFSGKCY